MADHEPGGDASDADASDADASDGEDRGTRPWYKRRARIIPLALLVAVVAVVGAAMLAGGDDDPGDSAAIQSPHQGVRPDRPNTPNRPDTPNTPGERGSTTTDAGRGGDDPAGSDLSDDDDFDEEFDEFDTARLGGYSTTLTGAALESGAVVVSVLIENVDDVPRPYGEFDWYLETEEGFLVDAAPNPRDDALGEGTLLPGEEIEGTLVFDLFGEEERAGTHSLVYEPDGAGAARGEWVLDL